MTTYIVARRMMAVSLAVVIILSCSACSKGSSASTDSGSSLNNIIPNTTAAESTDTATTSIETTTETTTPTVASTAAASRTTKATTTASRTTKATVAVTTAAPVTPYGLYHNAYAKLKTMKSVDMLYDCSWWFSGVSPTTYEIAKQQNIEGSNPAVYESIASPLNGISGHFHEDCYLNGVGYYFDHAGVEGNGTAEKLGYDAFLSKTQIVLPLSAFFTSEKLKESDFSGASIIESDGEKRITVSLSQEQAQNLYNMEKGAPANKPFKLSNNSIIKADLTFAILPNGYFRSLEEQFTSAKNEYGTSWITSLEIRYKNPGQPVNIDFPYAHYPQ